MAAKKINWAAAQTAYVKGKKSYREIAKKYNISQSALCRYASAHEWVKKREQFRRKLAAETEQKLIDKESDKLVRLAEAADKMAEVINNCIDDEKQFNRRVVINKYGKVSEVETKTYNVAAMRQLTGALKDLTEVIRDVNNIPKNEKAQEKTEVVLKMPEGCEDFDL